MCAPALSGPDAPTAAVREMRAAVLREPGRPVAIETVQLHPPRAGEVLVRVAAAGVCHSDLHLADGALGAGRAPIVLGHEGAGVVEAVGEGVGHVGVGDHVAFCFVPSCGACGACRTERPTLCETAGRNGVAGTLLDGTSRLRDVDGTPLQHGLMVACFAEYTVVPAAGAIPIPPDLPLWQAALIGCGVVTGVGAVSNAAGVGAGDQVCVVGCGGVGLQVIAAARLAGAATIVAVDRGPEKLAGALRRGATHVVDAAAVADPAAEIASVTGGGVDYAFEVVGAAATIRLAWDALAPGGTAVVVGLAPVGVEVSLPAIEFLSEKTIKGSYYGSGDVAAAFPKLVELVRSGRLSLEEVVSHVIALDEVEEAFERMRRGEGDRSVVIIDPSLAGRSAA
jgi:S-(hydroxymethyl)glutathione dehydrogenase/alcohol dehydrogenase